jgi:carbon-monoxide dehydrogenase medium subunit
MEEALAALGADPGLRPIAGGVGVMLARALGAEPGERWLGVGALPPLRGWSTGTGGDTVIGAAVTLEELGESLNPPSGLLGAASRSTANPGIRAVATLGGNVVAGRAASDSVAALAALGADAELVSAAGIRRVPIEELVAAGPRRGELVRAFHVPPTNPWGWQRLTVRGAMDSSVASVAVVAGRSPRVAVTFAAETVLRLESVERLLSASVGTSSGVDGIRAAAAADLEGIELRSDDRASEAYRRRVIPVLVERATADALARATRGG